MPVLKTHLLYVKDGIKFKDGRIQDLYSFIGTKEDYEDVILRCKYLDEELLICPDYKERLEYNIKYNSGLFYKQIHH